MVTNLSKDLKFIAEFTGIRAIAAFLVYLHHFNPINKSDFPLLYSVFNEFHIGVNFFFVLSGFLLWYRYKIKFIKDLSPSNIFRYFINRFARIYPVYFILTTITFILQYLIFQHNYTLPEALTILILNLTFMRGFFSSFHFSLVTQGWSLTVEECFYFLVPIIAYFQRRNISKVTFALAFPLLGYVLTEFFNDFDDFKYYGIFANHTFTYVYTIFGRFFEFFVGILLAEYFMKSNPKLTKLHLYLGFFILIISCLVLANICLTYGVEQSIFHPYGRVVCSIAVTSGIALSYLGILNGGSVVNLFLSSKIMQHLGKASYSFYLIHFGFLHDFANYVTGGLEIFNFILLVFISILIFKYIEEPLSKLIRRRETVN